MQRQALIDSKHIVARRHPREPLTIYNYTQLTAFNRVWNEDTLECRGLIVHDDGRVVARPYRKFFNLGEPGAEIPATFRVYDKLDGSLGISYREPSTGKIAISTRGSFESEQAIHATAVWRAKYADVEIPLDETWLFEIIYPRTQTNRHVLSYGDLDDLVLHGVLENNTGADLPLPSYWPGPVVTSYAAVSPAELPVRENAEGYVLVEHPAPVGRPARRVKVKFKEYERLHKLMDGLTPHRIWECLSTGADLKTALEGVPDEQFAEARAIEDSFIDAFEDKQAIALSTWGKIFDEVGGPGVTDRKTFALRINQEPPDVRSVLFAILSDKPTEPIIWSQLEP